MSVIRRLYRWVVGWADHPGGGIALAVVAFTESSIFVVPPDVLLIPLAFGRPRKSFFYAGICTLASVFGGAVGYLIGFAAWSVVGEFFFRFLISESAFQRVAELYSHHTFWAVCIAGFTPIPYKVFTLAAGVFQIPFLPFLLASLVGRGGRFFLVAATIFFFGERVRGFIEKRFELFTALFVLLLVGGFLVFRWVF